MAVDDLVGNITSALKKNNELSNSVIIFTSDNGYFYGEHRLLGKVYGYEEAIRVPLIVRAPGFSAPQGSSHFVLNNDLAPTISQFASVNPPTSVDGRSIIPVMKNQSFSSWRKRVSR